MKLNFNKNLLLKTTRFWIKAKITCDIPALLSVFSSESLIWLLTPFKLANVVRSIASFRRVVILKKVVNDNNMTILTDLGNTASTILVDS